jgi:hypothetical protein
LTQQAFILNVVIYGTTSVAVAKLS